LRNRINILSYIKKHFSFPTDTTNNNNKTAIEVVKWLSNAQRLFVKSLLSNMLHLAKITNPRLESQNLGDEFRHYCPLNQISLRLFGNKGISEIIGGINKEKWNDSVMGYQRNLRYFKLSYANKL
jgi:hypothetical protein